MSTDFDYVVVGAGINGSWAAYHLAQKGHKVLLVDRVRFRGKKLNVWLYEAFFIYFVATPVTR